MKRILQLQLGLLLTAVSAGCSCLHTGELGCLQAYYGGGITCRKDCDDDDCLLEKLFSCGDGACVVTPAGLPPMQCVQPRPMMPIVPACGPVAAPVCRPLSPIPLPPTCTPGTVCPPTPYPPTPCSTGMCAPPAIPGGGGLTPGVFRGTIPTGFVQGQIVSSQPVAGISSGQTAMAPPSMGTPITTQMIPSQTAMAPQVLSSPPVTNFGGGCPTGDCGPTEIPGAPVPSYPEIFQPEMTEYYDEPMPAMPDQFQMPQDAVPPQFAPAPHPVPNQPMPTPMDNRNVQPMPMNPMPMNTQPMPMDGGQAQPTATMQGPQGQQWIPVGF